MKPLSESIIVIMNKISTSIYYLLKSVTPRPVANYFRELGLSRYLSLIISKENAELIYQKEWAKEFSQDQRLILKYWKKYLYFNKLNEMCKFDNHKKFLDIGCGISTVLHCISSNSFGLDPLADEYNKVYNYPKRIKLKRGFAEKIPFKNNSFDIIFCTNTLDHTSDPEKSLKEIQRILKKLGFFILTVETFNQPKPRDPAHPHSFSESTLKSLIKPYFKIIWQKRINWLSARAYWQGYIKTKRKGLIMILQKQ